MVFKRYIHKHGKKLGPYYYENIRSADGRVRSVYVGTNPSHHTKHKVRKPLFFLILVLLLVLILGGSLFFLQNKAYLAKKIKETPSDFDVDQILLKVLIKSGEFIGKDIRVMNTGSEPSDIGIEVSGLPDIVKIESSSFTIKPGQTKILGLNFSSILPEEKIEQHPGIYVGKLIVKSQKASKEIPIVIEIETKNVLFDMNLNPVALERKVKQGSDTTIEVRMFNLESIESVNVDVEYFVKDLNGNTIMTESETVVVKTQASFFKTISVPKNLKPGTYVFAAQVKFGNSVGTSSYLFEVVGPEIESSFVQFCKNNILCLGLSLSTMLLLFALMAYFYFYIGAYLYEKVTGLAALPKKGKKKEEKLIEGQKSEEAEEIAEAEISNALKKLYRALDSSKKALESDDIDEANRLYFKARGLYVELENKEKQDVYNELTELYNHINELIKEKEQKETKENKELEKKAAKKESLQKETKEGLKFFFHKIGLYKIPEEKKQIELQKEREKKENLKSEKKAKLKKELEQKKLENEKLSKEIKEKFKEFFRKIGLHKTPEEKKQRAFEKERIENAKKEEGLRKQKQELLEKKRKEDELRQKKALEQKRREEQRIAEQKRKEEELKKQKESEKQKAEERRKNEEEKKKKEFEKSKQEEERKRNQEQSKAQNQELIAQIEAKLSKNRDYEKLADSRLKKLEAEKGELEYKSNKTDSAIKEIEYKILDEYKEGKELMLKKNSLSERYRSQLEEIKKNINSKKKAQRWKLKELKVKLSAKENSLMRELEDELSKLSHDKRKAVKKWKMLEIRGKLKLEEKKLKDELKKDFIGLSNEKSAIDGSYKKDLRETSKKHDELKKLIADLQSKKHDILNENKKAPANLANKDREIEKTRQKLERIAKEKEQFNAELSKLKSELKSRGFFKNLISNYREKIQKIVNEKKHVQEKDLVPEDFDNKKEAEKLKKIKASFEEKRQESPRSNELEGCIRLLNDSKKALEGNEISKARIIYIEAREIYVNLRFEEKKKVYNELMEIYNKLLEKK